MDKIAVIPVRAGSKRLPKKNYKPFNSRTLAEIARDKCLASGIFDKIVITSDDTFFEELVNCNSVEFLPRTQDLAADYATTDIVVDFLFEKFSTCESMLWVNSVSPLQSIEDIKNCCWDTSGEGKPEVLKGEYKGYKGCISRRINHVDRLVYKVLGKNQILILSFEGHYTK